MLDISDREVTPKTKNGVPFKLISDVCNPIIETSNLQTIFEEHVVCKNLRNYQPTSQVWMLLCFLINLYRSETLVCIA